MIRYTTPTITFSLPFEASYLTAACISLLQGGSTAVDKTLADCETSEKTLSITLSQEETAGFAAGTPVKVQLRCVGNDGKAYASRQFRLNVDDVLKEGVL